MAATPYSLSCGLSTVWRWGGSLSQKFIAAFGVPPEPVAPKVISASPKARPPAQ